MTAMELIGAGICIVAVISIVSLAMTTIILFLCDWIKQRREKRIKEFVLEMMPYAEAYTVDMTEKAMDKVIEKSMDFYNKMMRVSED